MVQTELVKLPGYKYLRKNTYISFAQFAAYKLDIHIVTRSLTILSKVSFMLPKLDLDSGYVWDVVENNIQILQNHF